MGTLRATPMEPSQPHILPTSQTQHRHLRISPTSYHRKFNCIEFCVCDHWFCLLTSMVWCAHMSISHQVSLWLRMSDSLNSNINHFTLNASLSDHNSSMGASSSAGVHHLYEQDSFTSWDAGTNNLQGYVSQRTLNLKHNLMKKELLKGQETYTHTHTHIHAVANSFTRWFADFPACLLVWF